MADDRHEMGNYCPPEDRLIGDRSDRLASGAPDHPNRVAMQMTDYTLAHGLTHRTWASRMRERLGDWIVGKRRTAVALEFYARCRGATIWIPKEGPDDA